MHILVGILVVGLQTSYVSARTWYIKADGTGDAPTIQAGVDSAAAGDTVMVGAGTYTDTTHVQIGSALAAVNVYLYKNIVLRGEAAPPSVVIYGWKSDTSIFVMGVDSTAVIASLKIRRTGGHLGCMYDQRVSQESLSSLDPGIHCSRSSPRIEGNEFTDTGLGVYLDHSRSKIYNNKFMRLYIGIGCVESTTTEISNNYFQDFYRAISATSYSHLSITNNHLDGVGTSESCDGITLFDASAYISDNYVHNVQYDGIWVYNDVGDIAPTTIENNRLEWVRWYGIELDGAHGSIVRANTFVTNDVALAIYWSLGVTVEHNTIDGLGSAGIYLAPGPDPVIRNNIITRVTTGIVCLPGTAAVLECNDVFSFESPYQSCPDQTGINGNISRDPQYCGIDDSGNYFLQSDSPCAPGNHPDGYNCGLIGAFPANCGKVDAEKKSWGTIKSLYKTDR